MLKLLLVEDDGEIVKNLRILLEEEAFAVIAVGTREGALERIEQEGFDLVLLDLTLPDGSGYSLLDTFLRHSIPVIILTAMSDENSVVTGFNLGADDYIVKPFRPMELISRVKNVLRRTGKMPAVFSLGKIRLDTLRASVRKGDTEIVLSALEYRLLLCFFNHQGEVLSRSRLLDEIWDAAGDYVNDNTLTVYIKRLREKIEDDPASPTLIKTVRGIGYILGD